MLYFDDVVAMATHFYIYRYIQILSQFALGWNLCVVLFLYLFLFYTFTTPAWNALETEWSGLVGWLVGIIPLPICSFITLNHIVDSRSHSHGHSRIYCHPHSSTIPASKYKFPKDAFYCRHEEDTKRFEQYVRYENVGVDFLQRSLSKCHNVMLLLVPRFLIPWSVAIFKTNQGLLLFYSWTDQIIFQKWKQSDFEYFEESLNDISSKIKSQTESYYEQGMWLFIYLS